MEKAKPLSEDEVVYLLDLIEKNKILTTKQTDAATNKEKETAWRRIATNFSANHQFRRPEQLKLKWENLKKKSRKRTAKLRESALKTGGGAALFIPDPVLDRVAVILGVTGTGFIAEFGGDSESSTMLNPPRVEVEPVPLPLLVDVGIEDVTQQNNETGATVQLPTMIERPRNPLNRKRKLSEEVQKSIIDKNKALAAYFAVKAEKLQLENRKLKLEIEFLENQGVSPCFPNHSME